MRRGELREEGFSQRQKAYEQAAPQRKRAMEEYPDPGPTEFRFQREAPDILGRRWSTEWDCSDF